MIALWMIYATAVAGLAVGAGVAAEHALRIAGRPTRWAWVGVMLLACAVLLAPRSTTEVSASGIDAASDLAATQGPAAADRFGKAFIAFPRTIAIPAASALAAADRPLRILWLASSLAWLLMLVISARSTTRRADQWMPAVVDGEPVLLSEAVGPALVGILRPHIVLPAWMLRASRTHLTLAIEHERQHALARDPALLFVAALALAVMPWNLPLWYAHRRLRLAVESDCDMRVLRIHPAVRAYGSLLITVCEHTRAGAAPLVALAEPASHLAWRIRLMTEPARTGTFSLASSIAVSVILAALACGAPRPTPTSIMEDLGAAQPADTIADSTLRRAVAQSRPDALTGGLGARPVVWIAADARDSVLGSATGREGFTRSDGVEVLTWESGRRMLPDLVPPSIAPGGLLQWGRIPNGRDTVTVIWFRLTDRGSRR